MLQKIAWLVLAAVHLMPALAFFRPATLGTLYGITPDNPLFVLMHHRAALFLAVFVACVWAAFESDARRLASVVAAISLLGFLWLYWRAGSPAPLRTIALVDLAGLPFLAFAVYSEFLAA